MTKVRLVLVLAMTAFSAIAIAACGSSSDSGGGGGDDATIIRGTTDQPISYDPAGAYDLPSYDGIYSMYQNLLTVEPGGNKAVPDAAEKCDFTDNDNKVFECTIKDGITFSDGSDLTAEDVAFSFKRNIDIADPNGASSLLANVKSIKATDDMTVEFQLKEPDATFPLAADHGLVRDRPLRRLPGRQAAAERRGRRLRPLHARRVRARPADGDGEERLLHRVTRRPRTVASSPSTSTRPRRSSSRSRTATSTSPTAA